MAAFVFKIFTLTIRTISKPLAGKVEQFVLNHPRLRQPVIQLAQVCFEITVLAALCMTSRLALPSSHAPTLCTGMHAEACGTRCPAQYLHRIQVAVDRGAEGKSGKVFVAHISEEKAMELAGRVVSEGFVWTVSRVSCKAHIV